MDEFYASMHSMGLFYSKESDGSLYYNGTWMPAVGDSVPPGGCFIYKWFAFHCWVLKRAMIEVANVSIGSSLPQILLTRATLASSTLTTAM